MQKNGEESKDPELNQNLFAHCLLTDIFCFCSRLQFINRCLHKLSIIYSEIFSFVTVLSDSACIYCILRVQFLQ
jgi:hypothetical protein